MRRLVPAVMGLAMAACAMAARRADAVHPAAKPQLHAGVGELASERCGDDAEVDDRRARDVERRGPAHLRLDGPSRGLVQQLNPGDPVRQGALA